MGVTRSYEVECSAIAREFPDAKFSICIDYADLDKPIYEWPDEIPNHVSMNHQYCTVCNPEIDEDDLWYFDENGDGSRSFLIKAPPTGTYTYRYVINQLIERMLFDPLCNHCFLEGICLSSESREALEALEYIKFRDQFEGNEQEYPIGPDDFDLAFGS